MSNDLIQAPESLPLYTTMCTAITRCLELDECLEISSRASMIAAYFKEGNDRKSEIEFLRVKLRAWRRLSELLVQPIDLTDYSSDHNRMKKVRDVYSNDETVKKMSDSQITNLIKLSRISNEEFEIALYNETITGGVSNLIDKTPSEIRRKAERPFYSTPVQATPVEDPITKELNEFASGCVEAGFDALNEAGITLKRKDRLAQKRIVFLLRKELYELLRKAAWDHRTTMHEILRRGLQLWFEANGYIRPVEETDINLEELGL